MDTHDYWHVNGWVGKELMVRNSIDGFFLRSLHTICSADRICSIKKAVVTLECRMRSGGWGRSWTEIDTCSIGNTNKQIESIQHLYLALEKRKRTHAWTCFRHMSFPNLAHVCGTLE
jgi:hypothetical protein